MTHLLRYFLVFLTFLFVAPATDAQTIDAERRRDDIKKRAIKLGVMLPLHQDNNDGRRMVEYYRGVLMACDSLKKKGISTDVYAWNLAENGDINQILKDPNAAKCDLIIGPLYSKFVPHLSDFVSMNNIRLVIPFSINAPQLPENSNMFQIYQLPSTLTEVTARRMVDWFKDCHPVIVDCADSTSTKGPFTTAVRKLYDAKGISYNLTSLNSSDANFANAFSKEKPNVVVLNSSRSKDLIAAFGKLSTLIAHQPEVQLALFGYTEWMMYVNQYQLPNFHRYNVYIPAPFYTNMSSDATDSMVQKYRSNFHQDMMYALPRFAVTGFDHAMFFLTGIHHEGFRFNGIDGNTMVSPIQTPLKFEQVEQGGYQNRAYMFIHYKPDNTIETVNY